MLRERAEPIRRARLQAEGDLFAGRMRPGAGIDPDLDRAGHPAERCGQDGPPLLARRSKQHSVLKKGVVVRHVKEPGAEPVLPVPGRGRGVAPLVAKGFGQPAAPGIPQVKRGGTSTEPDPGKARWVVSSNPVRHDPHGDALVWPDPRIGRVGAEFDLGRDVWHLGRGTTSPHQQKSSQRGCKRHDATPPGRAPGTPPAFIRHRVQLCTRSERDFRDRGV